MKTLKRLAAVLAVCLMVSAAVPAEFLDTTLTVEAHSGRTDSNGGHRDTKNVSGLGAYHYHCGGYPAHLHVDGVCPYTGADTGIVVQDNSDVQPSSGAEDGAVSTVVISDTSYDNAAFNASYYASRNTDVYQVFGDNAKALYDHFMTSGMAEGRQSSAQFSILVYRENNPDLAGTFGDDLMSYYNHFIMYGVNENRISK